MKATLVALTAGWERRRVSVTFACAVADFAVKVVSAITAVRRAVAEIRGVMTGTGRRMARKRE
jgi:hypothetical protein